MSDCKLCECINKCCVHQKNTDSKTPLEIVKELDKGFSWEKIAQWLIVVGYALFILCIVHKVIDKTNFEDIKNKPVASKIECNHTTVHTKKGKNINIKINKNNNTNIKIYWLIFFMIASVFFVVLSFLLGQLSKQKQSLQFIIDFKELEFKEVEKKLECLSDIKKSENESKKKSENGKQ